MVSLAVAAEKRRVKMLLLRTDGWENDRPELVTHYLESAILFLPGRSGTRA